MSSGMMVGIVIAVAVLIVIVFAVYMYPRKRRADRMRVSDLEIRPSEAAQQI